MAPIRHATVIRIMDEHGGLTDGRTDLVSLPRGADSTLFGGWGVRI
jgi:hypothetical protein